VNRPEKAKIRALAGSFFATADEIDRGVLDGQPWLVQYLRVQADRLSVLAGVDPEELRREVER
jgi:hypothetical protein